MAKTQPKKKPKGKTKQTVTVDRATEPKQRQYEFSAEAINALTDLNNEIDDMNKEQIVSEAVIRMALAYGIPVQDRKKPPTLESLNKVVDALCRYSIDHMEPSKKDWRTFQTLIQKAIDEGTPRNSKALWKAIEEDAPEWVWNEELILFYLKTEGIPR